MNLKRIGAVSLAATALATASLVSATAAQAEPGERQTYVTTYASKKECIAGNKRDVRYFNLFGDNVISSKCKEDITSFGGYRGYITLISRT